MLASAAGCDQMSFPKKASGAWAGVLSAEWQQRRIKPQQPAHGCGNRIELDNLYSRQMEAKRRRTVCVMHEESLLSEFRLGHDAGQRVLRVMKKKQPAWFLCLNPFHQLVQAFT